MPRRAEGRAPGPPFGVLHQGFTALTTFRIHGDANARADEKFMPINDKGFVETVENLF